MTVAVQLWIRPGEPEAEDAQRFLKANRYAADQVRDVAASPPAARDILALRAPLGDLWLAVDARKPGYAAAFPRGAEDLDDEGLAQALAQHPELLRTPILLTPKGGLAGFRERKWRDFLDIGKGRS